MNLGRTLEQKLQSVSIIGRTRGGLSGSSDDRMINIQTLLLAIILANCKGSQCPPDLDLTYSPSSTPSQTNFLTFAEIKMYGGSTSNFNQVRNGGKLPLIKGVSQFLNLETTKQVEIVHSYTIHKDEFDQSKSRMIIQLIVRHSIESNANKTYTALHACRTCNTSLARLNALIRTNMIGDGGRHSYLSFDNVTLAGKLEIRPISTIDRAALITIAFWCGFVAMLTCIYLMVTGTNLTLFPVPSELFMPITIRRKEIVIVKED